MNAFRIRTPEGEAYVTARTWYCAKSYAITQYGPNCMIEAVESVPPGVPSVEAPSIPTAQELASAHSQSMYAAGVQASIDAVLASDAPPIVRARIVQSLRELIKCT